MVGHCTKVYEKETFRVEVNSKLYHVTWEARPTEPGDSGTWTVLDNDQQPANERAAKEVVGVVLSEWKPAHQRQVEEWRRTRLTLAASLFGTLAEITAKPDRIRASVELSEVMMEIAGYHKP